MTTLHNFIEANMSLVNFAYGLVFFTVGLAVALKQRSLSRFRLARHLWLLAGFGIIHGVAEWGNVFIPIQSAYVSPGWVELLHSLQELTWAVSFAFLLQFAVNVIAPHLPWRATLRRFIIWYAPFWSLAVTVTGILLLPNASGENWIRYLLGVPAAVLSAAAFIVERQSFAELPSPTVKTNLTLTALPFALYGLLGGLVVPQPGIGPIDWLNYDNIFSVTGLPIQFYRAVVGLMMVFFVIRTLSIFDLELRHRLELNEKQRALFQDRQRIARDLHDGVIQSIYAAGLQLEVAANSLNQVPEVADAAGPSLNKVLDQLNTVITDIRGYIFRLEPDVAEKLPLERHLQLLIEEFASISAIEAELVIEGEAKPLTTEQEQNLIMIAQECLSNVVKHSLATCAQLKLVFADDGLRFSVRDNGIGIDTATTTAAGNFGRGHGLANISKRAQSLGARLEIDGHNSMGGAEVSFWLPYQTANNSN